MSERKAVFLVGPMGAGKSTLGRQLGHRFEGGFVDLDDYIVKVAGKSIPKIFEEDGEPYFRQLEHDCLEAILTGKSERIAPEFIKDPLPTIIAGGGGVAMREDNRDLIKAHTLCMYLYLDVDKQYARVNGDSNRPMINVDDVRQRLADLFEKRDPQYREIATIVLDSSDTFKGLVHRATVAIKIRNIPGLELKKRDIKTASDSDPTLDTDDSELDAAQADSETSVTDTVVADSTAAASVDTVTPSTTSTAGSIEAPDVAASGEEANALAANDDSADVADASSLTPAAAGC